MLGKKGSTREKDSTEVKSLMGTRQGEESKEQRVLTQQGTASREHDHSLSSVYGQQPRGAAEDTENLLRHPWVLNRRSFQSILLGRGHFQRPGAWSTNKIIRCPRAGPRSPEGSFSSTGLCRLGITQHIGNISSMNERMCYRQQSVVKPVRRKGTMSLWLHLAGEEGV